MFEFSKTRHTIFFCCFLAAQVCSQEPQVLPQQITLLTQAMLPVPAAVVESVQPVKAGTKVNVKSVKGEKVNVVYGLGEGMVDIASTDFVERAKEAQEAAEEAEKIRAANPERTALSPMAQAMTAPEARSDEARCREIALHEYPNDIRMQKYIFQQQLAASRYMRTVSDQETKNISLREYPENFSMQKYIYDQQSSGKRYMSSSVSDSEVRQIALREYPSDFSMQKYVYDQQLSAKQYLESIPDSAAKRQARREYPSDYSMQKYVYDQSNSGL
jgi:hypothetical protein